MKIDYSYSFPIAEEWKDDYAPSVEEITEHVFLAFLDSSAEPKIDSREHDRWVWCSFEEALKKLRWPGNVEALKRCEEVVRAKFAKRD
jgi:dATP pyrophosphohydrolase